MGIRVVDGDYVHSEFDSILKKFLPYAQKKLGYNKPVDIQLVSDPKNAKDPLGKTAYYDPNLMRITVFVDKRHAKDILRSLSHELVHHKQNCEGKLTNMKAQEGYAQKDPLGRQLEAEAYLEGNLNLRDYTDGIKQGDKEMHYTDDVLQEAWDLAKKLTEEEMGMGSSEEEALEDVPPVGGGDSKREQILQTLSTNDQIGPEKAKLVMDILDSLSPETVAEGGCPSSEEDIQEKQFANDDSLDGDKDGKPKWADKDDPANENLRRKIKENLGPNWARRSKDYQLFKELRRRWCK